MEDRRATALFTLVQGVIFIAAALGGAMNRKITTSRDGYVWRAEEDPDIFWKQVIALGVAGLVWAAYGLWLLVG